MEMWIFYFAGAKKIVCVRLKSASKKQQKAKHEKNAFQSINFPFKMRNALTQITN